MTLAEALARLKLVMHRRRAEALAARLCAADVFRAAV